MKYFLNLFLCSLFFISCTAEDDIKTITTSDLKILLNKENIQLMDVRTPKEIKLGAIETAIFTNYFDADFIQKANLKLDKNKTVYLVCRSGNRSGKACKLLKKEGYDVVNVLGGFNQWKKEN